CGPRPQPLRGSRRRAGGPACAFGPDGPQAAGDPRPAGRATPAGPVCRAGGGGPMSTTPETAPAVLVPKTANGAPYLEVDGIREQLQQLGLAHAAEALAEELSEAVKHNRPAHAVLDRLLGREVSARDERRGQTSPQVSDPPCGPRPRTPHPP